MSALDTAENISSFIQPLYELTNIVRFNCAELKQRCLALGWTLDYEEKNFDIQFILTEQLLLWIGVCDNVETAFAFLPLIFFKEEIYTKTAHLNHRAEFDAAFVNLLTECMQQLGPPSLRGDYPTHVDPQPYQYAIWPGQTAFFILQQHWRDELYGPEINFALKARTPGQTWPKFPLS